jgi:hypothetical protein
MIVESATAKAQVRRAAAMRLKRCGGAAAVVPAARASVVVSRAVTEHDDRGGIEQPDRSDLIKPLN